MSTKIYNGYRFDGPLTLEDLTVRLRAFGVLAREETDRLFVQLSISLAVQVIDATALGRPIPWKTPKVASSYPMFFGREHILERQREIRRSGHRDPEVDFECKVCVIPHDGRVYAMLYTEQETLTGVWERVEGVRHYPYWNNTDHPDDVTDDEWRARGLEWDEVLAREGIPAYVGMTFDAGREYMIIPRREDVAPVLAGIELTQRVEQWAADILQEEWCTPRMKAEASVHEWTGIFFEFRDWRQTDEGRAALAEKRTAVAAKLKPDLAVDDLYAPLTPVQPQKAEGRS